MQDNWKGLGTYGTLGLEIVLGVLLPSYVGIKADEHFGTGRTWLLVGFAFGLAHGVRAVYRALQQANKEAEAYEEEARKCRREYHDDRS